MARVVDGRDLVGWPGAPGCTTTGCWAQTGNEHKTVRVVAAIGTLIERSLGLPLKYKNFIGVEWSSAGDFNLSQGGIMVTGAEHAVRTPPECRPS